MKNSLIVLFILLIYANQPMAQQPPWPTAGWIKSSPLELGLNTDLFDSLDAKISNNYGHIRSFLVACKGRIVFEKYGQGIPKMIFTRFVPLPKV